MVCSVYGQKISSFDSIPVFFPSDRVVKFDENVTLKLENQPNDNLFIPGFVQINPGQTLIQNGYFLWVPGLFDKYNAQDFETTDNEKIKLAAISDQILADQLRPFYIKQVEVTNAEYREFIFWVRDSLARRALSIKQPEKYLYQVKLSDFNNLNQLNWKIPIRYYEDETKNEIEFLFLEEHKRYYRRREFNVTKFNYSFIQGDTVSSLNIYPDTTVWTLNLKFINQYYYDAMGRMYFWHPAYDDFPVVGLTIAQIEAFLHWKERQINNEFGKKFKGKKSVKLVLPSSFHYETAFIQQNIRLKKLMNHSITNPHCDLFISDSFIIGDSISDSIYQRKEWKENISIQIHPHLNSDYVLPKRWGSNALKYPKAMTILRDKTLILGLTNNVSEWTNTTFTGSRKWFFELWEAHLRIQKTLFPFFYFPQHPQFKEGHCLVIGTNFLDSRDGSEVVNISSIPYTYASPDFKAMTIGFRYIIHLENQK